VSYKVGGFSWLAEVLLASQEGLFCYAVGL